MTFELPGEAPDVLVVGAGCAGMRAAIEAFDAGANVALLSKASTARGARHRASNLRLLVRSSSTRAASAASVG